MRAAVLENRRLRAVSPALGMTMVFCGLTMLVPCGISLAEHGPDRLALELSSALALVLGSIPLLLFGRGEADLFRRDAVLVVVLSWTLMSVLGAMPFLLAGALDPIDALFESVSGFTTTGASVVPAVERFPDGLLFWRSLTHWLGGMGILVLAIVVLPFLGGSGYQLLKTEAPALDEKRVYPRAIQTIRALFLVYVLLTTIEALLLMLGGMSLFDSLAHAFGTIATGGFSTRNASVGAYGSVYMEIVIIIFMVMGSIPFEVHHRALGRPHVYLENEQVRLHLIILSTACSAVAIELWARGIYGSVSEAFRYATFQVTSMMTTTGFATADFENWTSFAHVTLIAVMLIGGCTGSTSGAIKTFRVLIVGKVIRRQIMLWISPRTVSPIRIGRRIISESVVQAAVVFCCAYLLLVIVGTGVLVAMGVDTGSAFTASVTTMGGVGPGLSQIGPYDNFAWMSHSAKLVCVALMLLGRLELFTFAAVFVPAFWRLG